MTITPARLRHQAAWRYGAYGFEALVGLAVTAFILRRVTSEEFGAFTLASVTAGLLALLDLGLPNLLVQRYTAAYARDGAEGIRVVLMFAARLMAVTGSIVFLLALVLAALVPWPYEMTPHVASAMSHMLVLSGAAVAVGLPARTVTLAYESRSDFPFLARVQIAACIARGLTVVAALRAGQGIVALSWGQLASSLVQATVVVAALPRHLPRARSAAQMPAGRVGSELMLEARWAFSDNLIRILGTSLDEIIIGLLASVRSVAQYSVAAKIPNHLFALLTQGGAVLFPSLARHHAHERADEARLLYLFAVRIALIVLLPIVFCGMLAAKPLIALYAGPTYVDAAVTFRWLLVYPLVLAISIPSDLALYAGGRVRTVVRITLVENAGNVLLTLAMVPRFGGAGAAFATAAAHAIGTLGWFAPAACASLGVPKRQLLKLLAVEGALGVVLIGGTALILWAVWQPVSPVAQVARAALAAVPYAFVSILAMRQRDSSGAEQQNRKQL